MTGEQVTVARIGVDRTRRGYDVVKNGLMPRDSALSIGTIIDKSDDVSDSFRTQILGLCGEFGSYGRIENLIRLSEMVAAAIEIETSRKLFMLGGMSQKSKATRQRQGIVVYHDNRYQTTIPYDEITSTKETAEIVRATRKAMSN